MNATAAIETNKNTHWIRSPWWDGFWIFFGLWGPILILIGYFVAGEIWDIRQTLVQVIGIEGPLVFLYVTVGVWHRMTSTYAVLGTPILRDEVRKNKKKYLLIPLGILISCLILAQAFVFHSAFSFMESTHGQLWAFFLLAYVMILWERWHFCAQEFGVLSVYRVKAHQFSSKDRAFDRWYTVVLMLVVNMALFFYAGFQNEQILFYGTGLNTFSARLLDNIALIAFLVGMGLMVIALTREWMRPEPSLPKAGFYFLIGSHTMLIYFCPEAFLLFFFSYIIHHWMVAIGLFNRITMNSYTEKTVAQRIGKYCIRIGPVVGVCVLWYYYFSHVSSLDLAGSLPKPDDAIRLFAGIATPTKFFWGIIIGLFFAFNFLHYYYDRCFYSFRDPAVRERVGPLLFDSTQRSKPQGAE